MRPTDALYYKRILLESCASYVRESEDADAVSWQGDRREDAQELLEILPDSDTYFVTAEMTAVARAAAKTLPQGDLAFDALPTQRGFVLFDRPVGRMAFEDAEVPAFAAAWCHTRVPECPEHWGICEMEAGPESSPIYKVGTGTGSGPVVEDLEGKTPCGRDWMDVSQITIYPLLMMPGSSALSTWGSIGWQGAGRELISINGLDLVADEPFFANFLATCVLMQQSLTEIERTPAERHEQKRWLRRGFSPQEITVVRLRRIDRTQRTGDGESSVDWSHRWIVTGHWRQQYYPSEGGNKPIWISPYVKGPDDRPIVVKDRVAAWVR